MPNPSPGSSIATFEFDGNVMRAALIDGISDHTAYLNIHTGQFPAGEIRGFLVAAPIPEPATWGMLGIGLAGLGIMARRRARAGLAYRGGAGTIGMAA